MKTTSLPLRVFALVLSLGLGGAYVYQRSGGQLFARPTPTPSTEPIAQPEQPDDTSSSPVGPAHSEIIWGSKSAAVVVPADMAPLEEEASPFGVPASETPTVIHGPKSAPIFLPADTQEVISPESKPGEVSKPYLLPGSKSMIVIDPKDLQQMPVQQPSRQSGGKP